MSTYTWGSSRYLWGRGHSTHSIDSLSLSHHTPPPKQRFDLGAYFVSVGADWRWSAANERRVRDAMARHFAGQAAASPALVRYRCLRHTWACMRPSFEVGGQGRGEGFTVEHEEEKDGALVAWLAARPEVQLALTAPPDPHLLHDPEPWPRPLNLGPDPNPDPDLDPDPNLQVR